MDQERGQFAAGNLEGKAYMLCCQTFWCSKSTRDWVKELFIFPHTEQLFKRNLHGSVTLLPLILCYSLKTISPNWSRILNNCFQFGERREMTSSETSLKLAMREFSSRWILLFPRHNDALSKKLVFTYVDDKLYGHFSSLVLKRHPLPLDLCS